MLSAGLAVGHIRGHNARMESCLVTNGGRNINVKARDSTEKSFSASGNSRKDTRVVSTLSGEGISPRTSSSVDNPKLFPRVAKLRAASSCRAIDAISENSSDDESQRTRHFSSNASWNSLNGEFQRIRRTMHFGEFFER